MSTFRNTGILALGIGLLVGYAIYDGKASEKSALEKEKSEMLLKYDTGQITLARINSSSGAVVVAKTDGKWNVVEPILDSADQEHIQDWLNAISIEKGQLLVMNDSKGVKWSEYGLENPLAWIELYGNGSSTYKFAISSHAAFDGSYYLKIDDKLYLGGSGWARHADQPVGRVRDKKVLRNSGIEADILELKSLEKDRKELVNLKKNGEVWESELQKVKISRPKVDRVISLLSELKASEFISSTAQQDELKKYGLSQPKVSLTVQYKTGSGEKKSFTANFGSLTLGSYFVTSSDFSGIAKISQSDGDAFKLKLKDFRDGTFPFKLQIEALAKVVVKTGQQKIELQKSSDRWQLSKEDPGVSFDPQKLEELLRSLNLFEASDYFSPQQKIGKVQQEVEFLDKDNKSLLTLKIGEEIKASSPEKSGSQLTYVTSSLHNEVLAVPSSVVNRLGLDKLVTQSEKK